MLATEIDEARRKVLLRLLEEEEAKLAQGGAMPQTPSKPHAR